MKQKASTLGMTNVGSGHNWRLMREIGELLSRNMAREGGTGPWFSTLWATMAHHREATRVPMLNMGSYEC